MVSVTAGIVMFQSVDMSAGAVLQSFYAATFPIVEPAVEPGDFLDHSYVTLFML
jgi:hypothetical protein